MAWSDSTSPLGYISRQLIIRECRMRRAAVPNRAGLTAVLSVTYQGRGSRQTFDSRVGDIDEGHTVQPFRYELA